MHVFSVVQDIAPNAHAREVAVVGGGGASACILAGPNVKGDHDCPRQVITSNTNISRMSTLMECC